MTELEKNNVETNDLLSDILSSSEKTKQLRTEFNDIVDYTETSQKNLDHMDSFLKVISMNGDLSIVYSSSTDTAFINLETMQITLPAFATEDKDLYILFGSHEVSHALHTPKNFYEVHNDGSKSINGVKSNGLLMTCLNIVEDIRIERLIKNKYPGFVGSYKRGNLKLFKGYAGFMFDEAEWHSMQIHNRLNAAAKLGSDLPWPLTDREKAILKYLKNTKTFNDVIKRSLYLYELIKKEQQDANTNTPSSMFGTSDETALSDLEDKLAEFAEQFSENYSSEMDSDANQDTGEGNGDGDENENDATNTGKSKSAKASSKENTNTSKKNESASNKEVDSRMGTSNEPINTGLLQAIQDRIKEDITNGVININSVDDNIADVIEKNYECGDKTTYNGPRCLAQITEVMTPSYFLDPLSTLINPMKSS